jgi:hypothetical protein
MSEGHTDMNIIERGLMYILFRVINFCFTFIIRVLPSKQGLNSTQIKRRQLLTFQVQSFVESCLYLSYVLE